MESLQLGVRGCLLLSHPHWLQLESPTPREHGENPSASFSGILEIASYHLSSLPLGNMTALKMDFPPSLCIPDVSLPLKSYVWVVAQHLHLLLFLCWVFHPQQDRIFPVILPQFSISTQSISSFDGVFSTHLCHVQKTLLKKKRKTSFLNHLLVLSILSGFLTFLLLGICYFCSFIVL